MRKILATTVLIIFSVILLVFFIGSGIVIFQKAKDITLSDWVGAGILILIVVCVLYGTGRLLKWALGQFGKKL